MDRQRTGRGGFTLVELLVVMAIALILIGGIYQLFVAQQRTFSVQDQTARMQQSARMAEDLMVRTLQQSGAFAMEVGNATLRQGPPILAASDHYVAIQFDDPTLAAHRGVIRAEEIVAFAVSKPDGTPNDSISDHEVNPGALSGSAATVKVWYDATGTNTIEEFDKTFPLVLDGINTTPYTLYRFSLDPNGNVVRDPVADNVDNFIIRYYDAGGNPIPRETGTNNLKNLPYVLSQEERQQVRSMDLELTLRSDRPDPNYLNPFAVVENSVGSYDSAGTPRAGQVVDDKHRRLQYRIKVMPRMGLEHCGDLVLTITDNVKCPQFATVTARVNNAPIPPPPGTLVTFTLPGGAGTGSKLTQGPYLGTVEGTDTIQVGLSGGEASVELHYTDTQGSVTVAASIEVDCRPYGPEEFRLNNAVAVSFVPGDPEVVLFSPELTYSNASTATTPSHLDTCIPAYAFFRVDTYDQCGNLVPVKDPFTIESVDASVSPATPLGTLQLAGTTGTSNVVEVANVASAVIQALATDPGSTHIASPPSDASRDVAVGFWHQTIRFPSGSTAPTEYRKGTAFTSPTFAGPDIYDIQVLPWPPSSTNPSPILGPPLALTNDCPGDPVNALFDVLECNGIRVWNMNSGGHAHSPALDYKVRVDASTVQAAAYGVLSGSDGSNSVTGNPISLRQADIDNTGLRTNYRITYTPTDCPSNVQNVAVPTLMPGTSVEITLTADPESNDADYPAFNDIGPSSKPVRISGCLGCTLDAPDMVNICEQTATVSFNSGCKDTYFLLKLSVLQGNVSPGGKAPYWITPTLGPTSGPDQIIRMAPGVGPGTAVFSIGDLMENAIIQVSATPVDNPASPQPGTVPSEPCDIKNVNVGNYCVEICAIDPTTNQCIVNQGTLCASTVTEILVEMKHCMHSTQNPYTLSSKAHLVVSVNGQPFDEIDTELRSINRGTTFNGVDYQHTVFDNSHGKVQIRPTANNTANGQDSILEFPMGERPRIDITWKDPLAPTHDCPASFFYLTPPLPLCFPNAITSGGGGSWNGNFLVHWGDVVIRGHMDAPGGTTKKVRKPDTVIPPDPPALPVSSVPVWAASRSTEDRYVDIYVGKALDGDPEDGNIVGEPRPLPGPNRPYLSTNYGNYFTNISNGKISEMIMVLEYETMKDLALTHSANSYWLTVPGTNQLYNPTTRVTLPGIEQLLASPATNPNNDGDYVFIDTYGTLNPAYPLTSPQQYLPPVKTGKEIDDEALAGLLPQHKTAGGFYTTGIIYCAGSIDFGGLGGTTTITAKSPPNNEEAYDHNRAAGLPFSENELPRRPISDVNTQEEGTLDVNINGAIYVDGILDFTGNPAIYGAVTAERGYGSGGIPEIWYNYDLNRTGLSNALCVTCCDLMASPASLILVPGESASVDAINNHGLVIDWMTSDSSIAKVDPPTGASSTVTAVSMGSTNLWLRDKNNCTYQVPVTVTSPCTKAAINPSFVPQAGFTFNLDGSTQPTAILTISPTDPAASWNWSSDQPGIASVSGSNATATVTGESCGSAVLTAKDTNGVCSGTLQSIVTVGSSLRIEKYAPVETTYQIGTVITIVTSGGTGNLTATADPATSAAVSVTSADEVEVTLKDVGVVTIRINDAKHANCSPAQVSFVVGCPLPTFDRVIFDNPAGAAVATDVWGKGTNNGASMVWQAIPNDNEGSNPLSKIDHVSFSVRDANGIAPPGWVDRNESSSQYCGWSGDLCTAMPGDISSWPNGFYTFTNTAYTTDYGCGVLTATTSTTLHVVNCAIKFADAFTTNPLQPASWSGPECTNGDCNGNPSITQSSPLLSLQLATSNKGAPGATEYVNTATYPLDGGDRFSMVVTVTGIAGTGVGANTRAGLRVSDGSGKYIALTGGGGAVSRAPMLTTFDGTTTLGTLATSAVSVDVTYRIDYDPTAATEKIKAYYSVNGGATWTSVGTANFTLAGNLKAGPFLDAGANPPNNRLLSGNFDNFSLDCLP